MQQFNAANQQNASGQNAGYQQQANMQNTQNANQAGAANTGLANQRTQYNAGLPQQVFNNQLNKAGQVAGQYNNAANTATGQGQQNAGMFSGLLGAGATVAGGMMAGPAGAMAANQLAKQQNEDNQQPFAEGGMVGHERCFHDGGICLTGGGTVPGKARVPGNSLRNDTVPARLSPGEAVIPRTTVQQNPNMVNQLLSGHGQVQLPPADHHPRDIAALLQAMKHMRGAV
jgi:hypothetical protein